MERQIKTHHGTWLVVTFPEVKFSHVRELSPDNQNTRYVKASDIDSILMDGQSLREGKISEGIFNGFEVLALGNSGRFAFVKDGKFLCAEFS